MRISPGTIINQIRSLLEERYKEGFPVIKEIIQNANDGGASTLRFGLVDGLSSDVEHPLLKRPALFFLNDGSFSKLDRDSISYFGIDANANKQDKIGKFGLGQKSVFHFCEAFFYTARSEEIPDGCGEFINPWARPEDGIDPKRPHWRDLTNADRNQLEKYLQTNNLVDGRRPRYFLLWIPLRHEEDKPCILANYYENEKVIKSILPNDLILKTGQLLPLLRNLSTIEYYKGYNNNKLDRQFQISLDSLTTFNRFKYPMAKGNILTPVENNLQGKVIIKPRQNELNFAGIEKIIESSFFASLMGQNPNNISNNFWKELQQFRYWTKRASINEEGYEEYYPDKSIPHCGVIFTQQMSGDSYSKLAMQWAVFLPLSSEESNDFFESNIGKTYQAVQCEGTFNYTIYLHGYFFLDSGRNYIKGLNLSEEIAQTPPQNEKEMILQWNHLLATRGTLPLILPSLQRFIETHSLKNTEITNICKGLLNLSLFQENYSRKCICQKYQWIFNIHPIASQWQLIPSDAPIRKLPGIPPNWHTFSKLAQFAENCYLIDQNQPNLLKSNVDDLNWKIQEVTEFLDSLDPNYIFSNEESIQYLYDILLEGNSKELLSTIEVQNKLVKLLNNAFNLFPLEQVLSQENTLRLIKLLKREKKYKISTIESSSNLEKILTELYQLNLNTFLVYEEYFKVSDSQINGKLESPEVVSILQCMSNFLNNSETRWTSSEIINQIINKADDDKVEDILNNVADIPLFQGRDLRKGEIYTISYSKLNEIHQKGLLFQGNITRLAEHFQQATDKINLLFLNQKMGDTLKKKLNNFQQLSYFNHKSCLQLIANRKPTLSSPSERLKLFRHLIQ